MNTKLKRFLAVLGLIAIVLLIISFVLSAFIGYVPIFQGLLFCIWAVPIFLWICIGLFGKLSNKQTMADLFPETDEDRKLKVEAYRHSLNLPPEPQNLTEEEIIEAMNNPENK